MESGVLYFKDIHYNCSLSKLFYYCLDEHNYYIKIQCDYNNSNSVYHSLYH